MISRKKKLRIAQISLLILGLMILFFTYANKENNSSTQIISKETQERIKKDLAETSEKGDIFYNIEYSGIDLAGNRYILKSEEAYSSKKDQEIVNMKFVDAFFYFKDNTILKVESDTGIYNNKTLDMSFIGNVKASYEGSNLFAEKAEYSNSESYLVISENVKINDVKGSMVADKLYFDIKKQTLNIASFNDGKISTSVNLK
tara:strand:- start:6593 stop:7198 length:606 start_codon:yes stop_codon:yes gene_type:complete